MDTIVALMKSIAEDERGWCSRVDCDFDAHETNVWLSRPIQDPARLCIALAKAVDPGVSRIRVMIGGKVMTSYFLERGRWWWSELPK